jgi:hypothetical protein
MEQKRKYDLEERLIEFAILAIQITETLYNTRAGNHIAGQLVRSGTSLRFIMAKRRVLNQDQILFIK